jgi:hypothetical protein
VSGFAHYQGDPHGGHEWVLLGCNVQKQYVTCLNSWGDDWSIGGRFYLTFADFAQLLADDGDVILPIA